MAAAAAVLAAIAFGACSNEAASDAERFCGEIGADPASIVSPDLTDEAGLDATLSRYRELADLAPVAIETEWRSLLDSLETASTVVPTDPDSVQRAVTRAYASERSAVDVRNWVAANCGVDLGPVATITPHD